MPIEPSAASLEQVSGWYQSIVTGTPPLADEERATVLRLIDEHCAIREAEMHGELAHDYCLREAVRSIDWPSVAPKWYTAISEERRGYLYLLEKAREGSAHAEHHRRMAYELRPQLDTPQGVDGLLAFYIEQFLEKLIIDKAVAEQLGSSFVHRRSS